MKNILFPSVFRVLGWILFVPGLVAGVIWRIGLINLSGTVETGFNDAVIISIVLGALFIVCSKEPHEDEMIRAIRLASLLNALYANALIFIAGTLFINGPSYLEFILFNLALLPIIFVFIFRAEMHRYYKENADEE